MKPFAPQAYRFWGFFMFNKKAAASISGNHKKSSLKRVIALAGPLYFVDIIWGAISLHAWLYISTGVAVSQILSYCLRKYRRYFGRR
jgi:hypothetical protein